MSLFGTKKTDVVKWKRLNRDFYLCNSGCDMVEARSPAKAWEKVVKLHDTSLLSLVEMEEIKPSLSLIETKEG